MNITKIEGIGPINAGKLVQAGVKTTAGLLRVAAGRKGRQELADQTGISYKLILEWANRADLMRVKGIGEEYSDLLEAAGVDTVRELAYRNSENLHKALLETNAHKKLVRREPSLSEVRGWVSQAKTLPPIISH
jgi:predicted flap endonuclease-1-like 5' DNA nuclease